MEGCRMPSDYEEIRNDEKRKDELLNRTLMLLGKMYSDRTHFIFELLQNAEDAGAAKILFELFEDRLEVKHDGRPFDERDVRGVCGVGEGTKAEDLTQIGKFGIGFKSVYAYTSAPEVHSGVEHFRIEHYVRPYKAATKVPGDAWTTLFVFAFDAAGLEPQTAMYEIAERLRNLSARTLLFLRNIKEIEYKLPDETGGVYLREAVSHGQARQVTVIGQNNGQDEDENWLVFERPLSVPDGADTVWVEIGFKLEANSKDRNESIVRIKEAPLVVYFPTEKSTRFGFLIQGPYRTTPSRDNIPKDDDWNTKLVEETALLLVDALQSLKKMGLLTVALLNGLPIRMDDFSEDGMFYPIVEAVRDALLDQELLPTDDGTFVSARNAKLARGAELRNLLTHDQLRELFQSDDDIKWLSGEITQDRTPGLRSYLMSELDVEEITPDGFARRISSTFLASQTDEWFIAFYKYLSGQEALWRSSRWVEESDGILRRSPILRLQDDKLVVPFGLDGMANAYLPPPEETDFLVVKREIVDNEQALKFLRRLGLSEPDVFDDIVEKVLPKYSRQDVSSITPREHAMDIQKILRAMASDSEAGKKKVLRAGKEVPFLKSVDQNGNSLFKRPDEIYFPNEKLKVYFSGCRNIWFLDEATGEKECKAFGVEDKPRFKKISIELPYKEKCRLRGKQGHTRDIEIIDYDLDGLENFLARFASENGRLAEYALILWNFLLAHLKEGHHYSFYEGQYKWFYYHERSAQFNARWKKQVLSHKWLPKEKDFYLHEPHDLSPEELPDSFIRDEKLAVLLGMKKDVVAKLAEEVGIDLEDIELLRRHPEEFEHWKAVVLARKEKPAFPTRISTNPDRRQERLAEQMNDATEKEYEQRNRSERTTAKAIDKETYLRNAYTNDDGQMVCQICKEEMPFKKRDGEYYFEAVEVFPKGYFAKEHEAQFLALCPLCAAKYKVFVKPDEEAMESLKNALINTEGIEIPLQLEEPASLQFVETHILDIRTILKAQEGLK